jgi:hypothetical protein
MQCWRHARKVERKVLDDSRLYLPVYDGTLMLDSVNLHTGKLVMDWVDDIEREIRKRGIDLKIHKCELMREMR